MRLRITEVLDYYDVPQLFVAVDAINTSYLCLTYDEDVDGVLKCIGTNISRERLNDFLTGHLDLRSVYTEPEMYLYIITVNGEFIETSSFIDHPEEYMLPDADYYLNYSLRENLDMITTSKDEGKTVLRLGYNFETKNHLIPTDVMSKSLLYFQSIVCSAYKKIFGNQNVDNAGFFVRATVPASFDLELISKENTDLFGKTKVSDTLSMIKQLFSDNDEDVATGLTMFKSAHPSYKSLVSILADNSISFKFKWVDSSVESKVLECPVTIQRISDLRSLASSIVDMDDYEEHLEGEFFMVNTKTGDWGFKVDHDGQLKKGKCLNKELLYGITMNSQKYSIICTVHPSRNPSTGKEYRVILLTDINKKIVL